MIQLPKSFNTKISPTQQMKLDGALEKFNIVSAVMHKLAKAFMVDIQRLKAELAENKDFYAAKDANLLKKQTELYEAQKIKPMNLVLNVSRNPKHVSLLLTL